MGSTLTSVSNVILASFNPYKMHDIQTEANIYQRTQLESIAMERKSPGFINTLVETSRLLSLNVADRLQPSNSLLKDWHLILSILELSNSPNLPLSDIVQTFVSNGHTPVSIEPVIDLERWCAFKNLIAADRQGCQDSSITWDIGFHGTPERNVPSIIRSGKPSPAVGPRHLFFPGRTIHITLRSQKTRRYSQHISMRSSSRKSVQVV